MAKDKNIGKGKKTQQDVAPSRLVGVKRFKIVLWMLCIVGVFIIFAALRTMLTRREYWEVVRERFTKNNIVDPAVRGNIYDCNGRLLVGSVPEYRICLDYKVIDKDSVARTKVQHFRDSAYVADLDSICEGLHAIFPDFTEEYFKNRLEEGRRRGKNGWSILPKHLATFIEYKQCKELPLFREPAYRGGFHGDEIMTRKKPYGSLASRTLGAMRRDSNRLAKNGIELAYDSILRGTDGLKHNTKVRNTRVDFTDKAAINGHDLMTTIDVNIQDAAEKAIVAQLKNLQAEMGIVIVMETKTGDVKALVNMGRLENGTYCEMMNYAVSECMEPGSTFKTASIMVGLEDGKFTKETMVETGSGVYMMHGRPMKDWCWATRGGFGRISVKTVMEQSSNVGVSRVIDEAYGKDPMAYVKGLERIGAGIPLDLPLPGSQNPRMKKDPSDETRWWRTTLPWMSIGYESLLPPISTCAFYNGIANGGKLVRPRFVRAEMQDGQIIKEFPVEVLREKMCSKSTLADIYDILENVVAAPNGTGKKARCPFRVCGKTGTAQIAAPGGGYHSGTTRYLISFCGFFPVEEPQYTCLVCIRKYGLPASGGGHCGPVFAQVAQAVMATGINHRIPEEAWDSTSVMTPHLTNGAIKEGETILRALNIPFDMVDSTQSNEKDKEHLFPWGSSETENGKVTLTRTATKTGTMPDVIGMGARDAVYALQCAGIKAKLKGAGRVESQSIKAGGVVKSGITVELELK